MTGLGFWVWGPREKEKQRFKQRILTWAGGVVLGPSFAKKWRYSAE